MPLGSYKTPTLTADAANKSLVSNVVRFETTESNGPISEIGIEGISRISLKGSSVWPGKEYLNKSIAQADGVKRYYHLSQGSERESSIKIYKNGVLVDPSEYKIMSAPYKLDAFIGSEYRTQYHISYDGYYADDGETFIVYDGYANSPQLLQQTVRKTKITSSIVNLGRDIPDGGDEALGRDMHHNKDKTIISISTYDYPSAVGLSMYNVNTNYKSNSWGPTTAIAMPAGLDRRVVVNGTPWSKDDKFVLMPTGIASPYIRVYNFDSVNKVFGAQVIGQLVFPSGVNSINFSKDGSRIIILKDASPYIEIRPFDSVTGLIGANIAQLSSIPEAKLIKMRLSKSETLIGFEFPGLYGPMICPINLVTGVIGTKFIVEGAAINVKTFDFSFDETYIIASEIYTNAYIYLIDREESTLLDPRKLNVAASGEVSLLTHHPVDNSFILGFDYYFGNSAYAMYMASIQSMKRTIKFNVAPASRSCFNNRLLY